MVGDHTAHASTPERLPHVQEWVVSVIDDLLERADLAIDEARAAITAKPGASLLVQTGLLNVSLTSNPTSTSQLKCKCQH